MKKYAKNVLFLVILGLLIYVPGLFLTSKFMSKNHLANGKNGVHQKLAVEPKNSLDVIVLGDSESYTSVSPMQLWRDYGFTVYAAGQPGAKLSETKEVLRTALKRQNPKVVMLETNSIFRFEIPKNETQNYISEKAYKKLPLLKEHNAWKSPFMELRGKTYKGFAISSKVKPYAGGEYMMSTSKRMKLEADNIETLESIKKMCEDKGAKFVLYSAPSPKNYNFKKHNALTALAKNEGVDYIDMNMYVKELDIDWLKDTRDKGDHLNLAGAVKTTNFMGQYLAENYNLPDRRNDSCAERWNKLEKQYTHKCNKAESKLDENAKTAFLKLFKD